MSISALFKDRDLALMAIHPPALNEWIENAISQHGIPSLMEMAGNVGLLPGPKDQAQKVSQHRLKATLQNAHDSRLAMDPADIQISAEHGIALVNISGTISPYYYDSADPRGIAGTIRELGAAPDIRTIVLNIDSPGGHATYVRELGAAIREVSVQGTRTVAHVGAGSMAASAAYWIAASADEIYGSTASMVGSIGVFSAMYQFSGMLGKLGITLNLFRDGALKGMGIFGKELTAEEGAHIQAGVDKVSAEFKGFIRARRPGIEESTMQGQVFDGDEGIDAKLLDGHVEDLTDLVAMEIERGGFV